MQGLFLTEWPAPSLRKKPAARKLEGFGAAAFCQMLADMISGRVCS